jgi:hypothetical protein
MELTRKEYELITKAEDTVKQTNASRIILLVILIVLFVLMVTGILDTDIYAYSSLAIVYFAIAAPFTRGPAYEELVVLLSRVKETSDVEPSHVDPIIEALTRKA